tara:strand:+ start:106 stop:360 length:255 start_codon:yes stop_codon:yes gene_type:complete
MGDATHRKSTANKPKKGAMKMKNIQTKASTLEQVRDLIDAKFDELSHTLIEDYPTGYANANRLDQIRWFDGFCAALEWVLEVSE